MSAIDLPAIRFIEPLENLTGEKPQFRCTICAGSMRFRSKAGALQHVTKKHRKPKVVEPTTLTQYYESGGSEFNMVEVKIEPAVEFESYGTEFNVITAPNNVENCDEPIVTKRPRRQKAGAPLYFEGDDFEFNSHNVQNQAEGESEGESTGSIKHRRTKIKTPKQVKKVQKKQTANETNSEYFEITELDFESIKKEVESENDSEVSSSYSENEEDDRTYNSPPIKKPKKSNVRHLPYGKNRQFLLFKPTYKELNEDVHTLSKRKWTEFVCMNFMYNNVLYKDYLPILTKISCDVKASLENLLPKDKSSIKITMPFKLKMFKKFGESNCEKLEFHTLKRFQSTKGTATEKLIYLGVPVKFLLWIPLPAYVQEQYLLVAYRRDSSASAYVRYVKPDAEQTLLILYKITISNEIIQSELHYVFHITNGPVNSLAFLPSGGYDASLNRLGLLAVGGVKSSICIYSLPVKLQITESDEIVYWFIEDNFKIPFIQLLTAFELILEAKDDNSDLEEHNLLITQCQRICWSEFSGHHNIFATYSNGYIAAWNIEDSTQDVPNLNYYKSKDGRDCFTPVLYFDFEESNVSGLAIHYDTCGPRWLTAYATSRRFCVYDIRNINQPIRIREEFLKTVPRCIDWNPIWETFSIGMCDLVPNIGRVVTLFSITGVNFLHLNLAHSISGISQVHFNPWQNITLFSSDNGDLGLIHTGELNVDFHKPKRNMLLSIMDIKCMENNENSQTENSNSNIESDQKKSYGFVFGEFLRLPKDKCSIYRDEKRKPPTNMEILTRINAVRWNLNEAANNVLAIGYENGILRLCRLNGENYFSQVKEKH